MKIKEIDRTANVAWSPARNYPIYLAAGTAAQQVDSSFSTNSVLELYHFDVNNPGLDMPLKASLPCENRFHKVIWGGYGMGAEEKDKCKSGIIVGGCDNGIIEVYDANKILEGEEQPLILTKSKHAGPVRALDFNSFRSNLIASGASDSETLIWDLNNTKTPMSPGAKPQPADDVTCLAWNKQVEHILASTFSNRCIVWDLRKNEPIIKVADTTSRIRYKVVAWHPTVATQMCLASEDDANPVIQLWDLRYATAPLKVLQGHERGVLGLAWCEDDPELLLSCGKDNLIHCWNPNFAHPGYERVCDIQTSCQWSFDVAFCPRNPAVISTASFDGRISVFGLSGGTQQPATVSKLADSFPGMDMDISHTPVPAQKPASVHLRDAPKWLKRPCGASFAFGGKLIHFANIKQAAGGSGDLPDKRIVTVSQIVTLPAFIERSQKLEDALTSGQLAEFCEQKSCAAPDSSESSVWQFLQASFTKNPTEAYLSLLGFDSVEVHDKLKQVVSKHRSTSVDTMTDGFVSLGRGGQGHEVFGAQLLPTENGTVFDTISQASTRSVTPEPEKLFQIPTDESTEGLLNQALLSGNLEYAVDLCLKDCRWADALILASTGGPDLIKKAQFKYFHKCENEASNMVRAVVTGDLRRLVDRCDLDCWRQALATALTYTQNPTEYAFLAETLGRRLEASRNEKQRKSALLCYISCGSMNRLVDSWAADPSKTNSPEHLQDVVEQVMVLKKSAEEQGKAVPAISKALADKLVEYASLLVSQGCLQAALHYLADATEPSIVSLKERVYYSLGLARPTRSALQPRSRQASESSSSRHGLLTHKRPSYPSAVQQASPPLANSFYDSRRPSGYFESPNLNSLTGPPVQSFDTGNQSNFYNPLNVNVNQPSFQSTQHTPGLGHGGSAYGQQEIGGGLRNPSAGNSPGSQAPLPPLQSWNDPPPLSIKSKPKGETSQPLQPITHPIFGSAQPEPQSFPPGKGIGSGSYGYGSGEAYGTPGAYAGPGSAANLPPPPPSSAVAPPPSSGFRKPTSGPAGHPPPAAYGQQSVTTPAYGSPLAYGQPPASQYGAPSPAVSSYGPPPTSSTYGAHPPPSSFGPPPTGSSYGAPPQPSSFGPPPTGSSYGAPPPASPFGPPPSGSTYGAPPSSSYGPPPSGSTYGAPLPSASVGPPSSGSTYGASPSSFGPPPSGSTYGAPPPSSFGQPPSGSTYGAPPSPASFGPPPSSSTYGAPPSSASHGPPPPGSAYGAPPSSASHGPAPSGSAYGAPPSSASHGPPPSGSAYGAPPSSASHGPPPSGSAFGAPPPSASSGPPTFGSTYGAPPSSASHGPTPSGSAFGAPPPSASQGPPPSGSTHGGPPSSASVGPPPSSSTYGAAPPSASHGPPPSGSSASESSFAPPTSGTSFVPPPSASPLAPPPSGTSVTSHSSGPPAIETSASAQPQWGSSAAPPTSGKLSAGSMAPPSSGSSVQPQRGATSLETSFAPRTSGTSFAPPTSGTSFAPPTSGTSFVPQPSASPIAPPPSGPSVTSISSGSSAAPPTSDPPSSGPTAPPPQGSSAPPSSSSTFGAPPSSASFGPPSSGLTGSATSFVPPPTASPVAPPSSGTTITSLSSGAPIASPSMGASSFAPPQFGSVAPPPTSGMPSSGSIAPPPTGSPLAPPPRSFAPPPNVSSRPPTSSPFTRPPSGTGFSRSPSPYVRSPSTSAYAPLPSAMLGTASAPPITSFGPPFAPPSDASLLTPVSLQDTYTYSSQI